MRAWIGIIGLGPPLLGGCGNGISAVDPRSDPREERLPVALIYVARADGSRPVALTLGERPAWSPDGGRIAFHRAPGGPIGPIERAADGEIYVIDADGSDERPVGRGIEPAWSPDGDRIAFADGEGIGVMNADGSGVTTLIRHDFRDDTYEPSDMGVGKPAWSPDGTRIAFEHLGDGDLAPAQVYVMNADGSEPRRLTLIHGAQYAESDPVWSPEGSRIALWSFGHGIAIVDAAGGSPKSIYADFPSVAYGTRPAWSPAGTTIAFTVRPGPAIWIMRSDGSAARPIIDAGYDAAWSPDGEKIAFARDE